MTIEESVENILKQKQQVIQNFYELFLSRHSELRRHFDGVNLDNQATMLTMALIMVEAYYSHEYTAAESYLQIVGSRHRQYGIDPNDFPKFRECLLETLETFHGNDWNAELAGQWRQAVDKATAKMHEGYENDYDT